MQIVSVHTHSNWVVLFINGSGMEAHEKLKTVKKTLHSYPFAQLHFRGALDMVGVKGEVVQRTPNSRWVHPTFCGLQRPKTM